MTDRKVASGYAFVQIPGAKMSGGGLGVTLPELSVGPSVAGIDGTAGMTTIPALPQAPAPQISGFSPVVNDAITQALQNNPGLSASYMQQMAQIESRGNPNAFNKGSRAAGLYQFIPSTASNYDLSNPFDPHANANAAAQLALDNKAVLQKALGRDPSDGELYLAHQQGASGAAKLLSNPDAPATSLIPARNITSNGGNPNMTAAQYANMWTSKFGAGSSAGTANPGMSAGSTAMQGGFGLNGIQAQGGPVAGQSAPPGVPSLANQPMTAMGPTAQSMVPGQRADAGHPASPYSGVMNALQGAAGAAGKAAGGQQKAGGGGGMGGAPDIGGRSIGLLQARQMFDPSQFFQMLQAHGVGRK